MREGVFRSLLFVAANANLQSYHGVEGGFDTANCISFLGDGVELSGAIVVTSPSHLCRMTRGILMVVEI
jgi:hypothetical protein